MTEVHRSKAITSMEPLPFKRNVVTEFVWEVSSVKEQVQHDSIDSPYFKVHGTTQSNSQSLARSPRCALVKLSLICKRPQYILQLSPLQHYTVSVDATLSCGDCQEKCNAIESNGRGFHSTLLIRVADDGLLGAAIQERNSFSAIVRITTVSAQSMPWSTILDHEEVSMNPSPSLVSDLRTALNCSDFADVTLTSEEGTKFPAHRQFLAMRSPVFRAMFYGQMREARSGAANINASSRCVKQLLDFIYTDELDADIVESLGLELFDVGTQYQLPRLITLVKDQLLRTLSQENACERLLLGVRFSVEKLEKACEAIIKSNLSAVMRTEGWTHIVNDPEVMHKLMNSDQAAESSPRKLKRPRFF